MTKLTTKFKETEIGTIPKGWESKVFSDLTINFDNKRKPLSSMQRSKRPGIFPYYGASGIVDYIDDYAFDETLLLISEDGENLKTRKTAVAFFAQGKYWVNNHAHVIKNKPNTDLRFIKYWFDANSIAPYLSGSVQPKLSRSNLDSIEILTPQFSEQKLIAEILSSLDDKIELNRKINANLEKLAATLFKKWLVDIGDELPEGWRMGALGEAIINFDSKRVPLSSREREKRQGSYPYYGATSIMDYVDDFIFDGTYVFLGEDGSVAKEDGKPFVQYVHGKMWVNNHAHVLQGKNGFSTEYIKVFLDQVDIMPFVTGAVQPKLNQANMNSVPMVIPDQKTLDKFNEILSAFFGMILENESQIKNLEQVRDSLLPRLMNGKIRTRTI